MIEIFKNEYIAVIIVAVCIIVFRIANSGSSPFGVFVNRFFPCEQNPGNSFPCFAVYDIVVMVIVTVIGLIFLGILVFDIYKTYVS